MESRDELKNHWKREDYSNRRNLEGGRTVIGVSSPALPPLETRKLKREGQGND
jgi:hypothetical protein